MAYAWPPLPILDPDQAAAHLRAALDEAYGQLEAERLSVVNNPRLLRRPQVDAWLREFEAAIVTFRADADVAVRSFLELHLQPVYQAAVLQASGGVLMWTTAHQAAMVALSIDTYDDFLARSQAAGQTAEAMAARVRDAAARTIPRTATGATTAKQAGRKFADLLLEEYRVDTVTYANGAKVPVRHYADMAARTKSAVAYNAGTLNASVEAGVSFVEVFDGSDCGWTTHEDSDKANGTIRPVAEAMSYAISHPNCGRAFGPRPDLRTKADAKGATPSTTAAQRADQAQFEATSTQPTRTAVRRRDALAARRAQRG